MGRLTNRLRRFVGFEVTRKPELYISIDTCKRNIDGRYGTDFNYYAQWKSKAAFKVWLKENVAKRDWEDWILFKREDV